LKQSPAHEQQEQPQNEVVAAVPEVNQDPISGILRQNYQLIAYKYIKTL